MISGLENMQILIVDDSLASRKQIELFLNKAGYQNIVTAESAVESFEILGTATGTESRESGVDLILMDVVMDDIDGIEACQTIKESKRLEDIPIIMVTGSEKKETFEKAFEAGAMDYVSKPINRMELRVRVNSALKLRQEMSLRKKREKELERLSYIDGLTGIPNRRIFDSTIEREWKRAIRDSSPLSVIIIDIDFFKLYNDNYGHQAGDHCLIQVAALAVESLSRRAEDFVARYGGEEFVAILPGTEPKQAKIVGERFREKVMALGTEHATSEVSNVVSISLGVAGIIPTVGTSYTVLIEMADHGLYKAKANGRNRAEIFDPS